MPSSIKSFIHRFTGLANPTWLLKIGTTAQARSIERGERGVILAGERRYGAIRGGVPIERCTHCDYSGTTITGPKVIGKIALTSFFGARIERSSANKGAEITSCDLKSATIIDGSLAELSANGCSFAEATIENTQLGQMSLCDLSHSRLSNLTISEAIACDFSGAILTQCDFSGADLSGSTFVGAVFEGTNLLGATVSGVDFSGSSGLDLATKDSIVLRGGSIHNPILWGALRRIFPKVDTLDLNKFAGTTNIALVLALFLALFAVGTRAISAEQLTTNPENIDASRDVITETAGTPRQRTIDALRLIRGAIQEAHETMLANGDSHGSWPKATDLSNGHYDLDGAGDGEAREMLIPNGVPQNPITSSNMVTANCDNPPSQDALDINIGWLYCEQTGEVYACSGSSGEATINW